MASITDVAKTANVSIATVSRVLTGSSHPVSEETRTRVLQAARALSYSPSALAKAMVTGDTRIIGVIIGDANDPYFAAIVRSVEDIARQQGYLVIVCNSDRVPAIELKYLRTLNDYRVDGVIFAGGGLLDKTYLKETKRAIEAFYERGAVCVSLGKHLFPSVPVLVDNTQAVRDATDHLLSLGHTQIAYISGPDLVTTAELRLSGYRAALASHGLELFEEYVLAGDYKYEAGLRAAQCIHQLRPKPTAVMASNDIMAVGCIIGLKEQGYRVPEDISVVGVDDIPIARIVDPPLTTVSFPLYDLGAIGMQSLIRLRNGEMSINDSVTLPHHLVVRKSTAPPGTRSYADPAP